MPAFGWRGDTENGRRCWFILVAPPELVLLTSCIGFLPMAVVVVLYSIILHHALRKVIQLKQAYKSQGAGAVAGNLRMHVGASPMPCNNNGHNNAPAEMSRKVSRSNNGRGDVGALSDTEEPLQPTRQPQTRGFFRFLSRWVELCTQWMNGWMNPPGEPNQRGRRRMLIDSQSVSRWVVHCKCLSIVVGFMMMGFS